MGLLRKDKGYLEEALASDGIKVEWTKSYVTSPAYGELYYGRPRVRWSRARARAKS